MGAKNKKKNEGEQKNENDNNKKKDNGGNDNITAVLKADLHCDGCASKFLKCIRSFDGVKTLTIDESQKITVTGEFDPAKLREKVEEKTHKKVELISPGQPKKNDNNKENEKGKENGKEDKNAKNKSEDKKTKDKKEGGGGDKGKGGGGEEVGGNKGKGGGKGKDGGGEEGGGGENKVQVQIGNPYPYMYALGPVGDQFQHYSHVATRHLSKWNKSTLTLDDV
ncbi:heavy metal-associated isoprenylated plant 3-like [Olea europaea subsp. europaea]|uniref:Heavy metal-associated isoprenylated plant 3-like n=1 Tax=Olea europaea subsp. europaea TaxID=158383 RepID=A0A8S0QKL5_OLEEU|nr:heavy metal-associated isoprenylated plant 3-like [Olea europaea subsp. europaea]